MFVAAWLALFALRPDLRLFSLAIIPLGPVSEIWYLRDFWQRPTITGYLHGGDDVEFSWGLIGGVIYDAMLGRMISTIALRS
jgi:hypothetical protein